ncbi:MAG: hypothetical protein DWQ30_13045 [Acidobacteria bacterium]|mgnify:FL=1|nr:MAG: hypothetical protein DWQ30_13045 [Acidobacteriota bacterium]
MQRDPGHTSDVGARRRRPSTTVVPCRLAIARHIRRAPFCVALTVLVLAVAPPTRSQSSGTWERLGPDGGEISTVHPDPHSPETLWVGTWGGNVYRSGDRGSTWELAGDGLEAAVIYDLAGPQAAGGVLIAATDRGIYRLDEQSRTWQRATVTGSETEIVVRVAVDPVRSGRMYATVSLGVTAGVYRIARSDDSGLNWNVLEADGLYYDYAMAIAPTDPPTLYVSSFGRVRRSTDGGETWQDSAQVPVIVLDWSELLVDPHDPQVLYASVRSLSDSVLRSEDGGQTWIAAGSGLPDDAFDPQTLAVWPNAPGRLLLGHRYQGLFASDDAGQSWSAVAGVTDPEPSGIGPVAVSSDGLTAFAALDRSGAAPLRRAPPTLDAWQALGDGITASSVVGLAPRSTVPGEWLASTGDRRVVRTTDDGATWQASHDGIEGFSFGRLTRSPDDDSIVYLPARSSVLPVTMQVYRSSDAGVGWTRIGEGLPCCGNEVVVDPFDPLRLRMATWDDLVESTDGGATWQTSQQSWLNSSAQLAASPHQQGLLVAGTSRDSGLPVSPPQLIGEIRRSTDGGQSWQLVFDDVGSTAAGFWELVFDPEVPGAVYGAYAGLVVGAVVRSLDGGATWERLPLPDIGPLYSVTVGSPPGSEQVFPRRVLVGTRDRGVWFSDDGANWAPLEPSPPAQLANQLVVDPADDGALWMASSGGGVLRYRGLPPTTACEPTEFSLCLLDRFEVAVVWADGSGAQHVASLSPISRNTAGFWFFTPDNLELAIKIVDGRWLNGHHWLYYGALSDVAYEILVLDHLTGEINRYENLAGQLASFGDIEAFPEPELGPAAASPQSSRAGRRGALREAASSAVAAPSASRAGLATASAGNGIPTPEPLRLGRFEVLVSWYNGPVGGFAAPQAFNSTSGAFWIFQEGSLDVFLKILDGTVINGRHWLFVGALTDVGLEIQITDTADGSVRHYSSAPGEPRSFVDIELF